MTPHDMVYSAIYKGALRAGAQEKQAKDQAIIGLEKYKKGKFKKPIDLIEEQIKLAKQLSEKTKKSKE